MIRHGSDVSAEQWELGQGNATSLYRQIDNDRKSPADQTTGGI